MRRARTALGVLTTCALLILSAVVAWFLLGPEIDNRLQIFAGRDLELVRQWPSKEGRLDAVVRANYEVKRWEAYHLDGLYLTNVDCHAVDRAGEEVVLSWEVGHGYTPRAEIPEKPLSLYALTREAAALMPDLMPPGMWLDEYPPSWARVYHSSALPPPGFYHHHPRRSE